MIKLLFFGRLSDYSGLAPDEIELAENTATPAKIRDSLSSHAELHHELSQPQILVAINQQLSDWNRPLQADDEVAFLPPVTGG